MKPPEIIINSNIFDKIHKNVQFSNQINTYNEPLLPEFDQFEQDFKNPQDRNFLNLNSESKIDSPSLIPQFLLSSEHLSLKSEKKDICSELKFNELNFNPPTNTSNILNHRPKTFSQNSINSNNKPFIKKSNSLSINWGITSLKHIDSLLEKEALFKSDSPSKFERLKSDSIDDRFSYSNQLNIPITINNDFKFFNENEFFQKNEKKKNFKFKNYQEEDSPLFKFKKKEMGFNFNEKNYNFVRKFTERQIFLNNKKSTVFEENQRRFFKKIKKVFELSKTELISENFDFEQISSNFLNSKFILDKSFKSNNTSFIDKSKENIILDDNQENEINNENFLENEVYNVLTKANQNYTINIYPPETADFFQRERQIRK